MDVTRNYISCADTAKLVRAELKAGWPSVKFSVRSKVYSGGASITASWTDGPTSGAVDAAIGKFAGADFDGMIDLKTYRHELLANEDGTLEDRHYGADFVFTQRGFAAGWQAKLEAEIAEFTGQPFEPNRHYDASCFKHEGGSALARDIGRGEYGSTLVYQLAQHRDRAKPCDHLDVYGCGPGWTRCCGCGMRRIYRKEA